MIPLPRGKFYMMFQALGSKALGSKAQASGTERMAVKTSGEEMLAIVGDAAKPAASRVTEAAKGATKPTGSGTPSGDSAGALPQAGSSPPARARTLVMSRHAALRLAMALPVVIGPAAVDAAPAELRIGIAAPLNGPDSVYGEQIRQGVEQAIADLNASGGFLGRRARSVPRDDGNDPGRAVEVAKAFAAAGVSVVIGDFSSAATVAASSVYADAGILNITPSALAPAVTDRGLSTIFRVSARDDEQAGSAARLLLAHHIGRVAIVHDRTGEGKALADAVRTALGKAGVADTYYGSLEKGTRDMSGLVGRIKASGAQVVVFGGGPLEAGLLMRQLRDAGSRATLIGGSALASDDFAAAAGTAADGAMLVFPQDPRTRPAAADLLRRLRSRGQEPDAYVFYAYAAVQVIQQAMEASRSVEPAGIAAAMRGGVVFKTVLGYFSFDAKGDPSVSDDAVYVWHKGASGRMTFDEQARF